MTIEWDGEWTPPVERELPPSAAKAAAGGTAFEGSVEFSQAIYEMLNGAIEASALRLCWCDADFAAWPLGDADFVALLTRWARGGSRELVMIASDYQPIERLHPRFAAWRRDWAHAIQCLVPDESVTTELPTLWIDASNQALRVFDRERLRGRAGIDRVDRQAAREEFDAILQRAVPGFSSTTLGL